MKKLTKYLAGEIVFISLVLQVVLSSTVLAKAGYTTAGQPGTLWDDAATWAPSQPGNALGGGQLVDIYRYIRREGDLTITGGADLYIHDTLWITKNLNLTGGARVYIEKTGVLVVGENINMSGGARIENLGRTVVKGKVIASGGSKIANLSGKENGFYLYGEDTRSGVTKFTSLNGNGSNQGNFINEQGLFKNDPILYEFVSNITTLPVTLLFFKSSVEHKQILLTWATAMEENFDYFTIERAGVDQQFEVVGTVEGHGFSTESVTYQFADQHPVNGISYYRLVSTDIDGSVTYHKVISQHIALSFQVALYPNPATGETLYIHADAEGNRTLKMLDGTGSIAFHTNLEIGQDKITLPEDLKNGLYQVLITNVAGQVSHTRLLISR